jgi:hypothetical protein
VVEEHGNDEKMRYGMLKDVVVNINILSVRGKFPSILDPYRVLSRHAIGARRKVPMSPAKSDFRCEQAE